MTHLSFFETLPFYQKIIWFFGLMILGWAISQLITLVWEKALLPLTAKVNSSLDCNRHLNGRKFSCLYPSSMLSLSRCERISFNYSSRSG